MVEYVGPRVRAPACDVLDADGAKETIDIPHFDNTGDSSYINAKYELIRFERLAFG
jgi:hypothetical protein